jgi:hypothetical protein
VDENCALPQKRKHVTMASKVALAKDLLYEIETKNTNENKYLMQEDIMSETSLL